MIDLKNSKVSKHEKKILIYKYDGDNVICYGPKGEFNMKLSTLKYHLDNPSKSEYHVLKHFDKYLDKISDYYNYVVKCAEELKDASDGRINLYKTGKFTTASLQLFSELTQIDFIPKRVKEDEFDKLEKSSLGALIWCKEYKGKGYEYDICSMYPSIMKSSSMSFPVGRGKVMRLSQQEIDNSKFFKYGLYNCHIDVKDSRLMRTSKQNWYTHFDLTRAKELKYDIKMIDSEENALIYSDDLMNGKKLFGDFVDYMYNLKKNGVSGSKDMINCLWGLLCREKKSYKCRGSKDKELDLKVDGEVWLKPSDDDDNVIDVEVKMRKYMYSFARIKPFILSKARYIMSKIVEHNLNHLVYMHTDGLILTRKDIILGMSKVSLGSDIGELKYKGYDEKCKIKSATNKKFTPQII